MSKLSSFDFRGSEFLVRFVEQMQVKEGVDCDVYAFAGDDMRDLAIVMVKKGFKTPLQKVVEGTETIEGFMSGKGTLRIGLPDGQIISYVFPNKNAHNEVIIAIGQTMQWQAAEDLTFYEICSPPYKDGRFIVIPD